MMGTLVARSQDKAQRARVAQQASHSLYLMENSRFGSHVGVNRKGAMNRFITW